MTKYYAEGDKVRYVDGEWFDVGDILTVLVDDRGTHMPLRCADSDGTALYIDRDEVEPLKPSYEERLSEAEAMIAELEYRMISITDAMIHNAKQFEMMRLGESVTRKPKQTPLASPNQRRADVIKRAQAFVADLERRAVSGQSNYTGNDTFKSRRTKLTFHVNADKGVVTALAHDNGTGGLRDKAFAKCDPDDVFNADIGKAIAAGRLYGVDIPKEFLKAPMPTEVVVGMRVKGITSGEIYEVIRFYSVLRDSGNHGKAFFAKGFSKGEWVGVNQVVILNDSDAVYV